MKKAFGEYSRLARGAFGCSSLWLGKEHLLYVHGTGLLAPVSENYQRVRYRDVQALTVVRTRGWMVMNWICGLLLLLFGVPAVLGLVTFLGANFGGVGEEALAAILAIGGGAVSVLVTVVLVWNLVRGRTCKLGVQTANGIVVVRAANRVRVAERVVGELVEIVEAKQGVSG